MRMDCLVCNYIYNYWVLNRRRGCRDCRQFLIIGERLGNGSGNAQMWHMQWTHKIPMITIAGQQTLRQAPLDHLPQRRKNKVRILVSALLFE